MFKKILIANRGEIALRVIRTCKEMGIKTVAVYSTADANSLHVRFADEAVCIGPPTSKDSYLKIQRIIAAAAITNAEAIHPGYGFLAENAEFSRICEEHNIKFIGPSPDMITAMGDKSTAKANMIKFGVPVVPGSDGNISDLKTAEAIAKEIGYPVIIKATAGGGGRGMRIVLEPSDFKRNFDSARQEAGSAFGNPEVYIEKYIEAPRHVEIQVLGDRHGYITHLGERDCSLQRRHQKIMEESPSPVMEPWLREKMGDAAVRAAETVNYEGAGTVEFLVDKNLDFYFMEMNTRIQVEHPVTEEVTNADLIKNQIEVAYGLPLAHKPLKMRGHAIECRINAEDPEFNFRPSAGKITTFHLPGGHSVRVDTHAYSGYVVPPYYDSMIAKLIVSAPTRLEAIARMKRALEEFVVEGIKTTIPYHLQLMDHPAFLRGEFTTHFLEKEFKFNPNP
ncbi:MAG: acetyl-CoA carboxylase biotin carboxylase subunit [Candidatus Cyclonatronum sp.]|uniref:acetyl-CoA carboxylase biotin carboxylase subunit n=1 Tax=Cyclonatronum sp. TaxID=3024185 RepID=UPI0025C12BEB|nr:acetyl-CoA carboxylase biotin carboxylase subunit [Cyclonatronum sp.]MCC5933255.1 acetyl-CoA carboxylase biotin carboxylase subunit [Balneolales bacterium]MCH8485424.1 acetyl-CoA carboxylase biotin carboxylase subunit [Cyclonatronum sp.]